MRHLIGTLLALAGGAALATNVDGALDTQFGTLGRSGFGFLESDSVRTRAIVRYPGSGRIWMFGDDRNDPSRLYIARLLADGQPDTGFGPNTDGRRRVALPAATIVQSEALSLDGALMQSDGKPVVFGGLHALNGETGAFPALICRLTASGALDGGFGVGGCRTLLSALDPNETCRITDAAFASGGQIVVVGNCQGEQLAERPFLARLTPAGALDLEFGAGAGLITPPKPAASAHSHHYEAVVVRPDDRIVVAGDFLMASNSVFDTELGLIQFDGGGSVDTSFGSSGFRAFAFDLGGDDNEVARDLVLRADGRVRVLGEARLPDPSRTVAVFAQALEDGGIDSGFGTGGKRVDELGGLLGSTSSIAALEIDELGRTLLAATRSTNQPDAIAHSGTDFWTAFAFSVAPETPPMLRIASDVAASGTVSSPAYGVNVPFSVAAGGVTEILLPEEIVVFVQGDNGAVGARAVHIVADAPVTVMARSGRMFTIDTTMVTPTPALGTRYRVMSWGPGLGIGSSQVAVGTEQDTTVTITPRVAAAGHPAGLPFQVELDAGQSLHLWRDVSDADLTGSLVVSDKPIALISGHGCAQVPDESVDFCDLAIEQMRPVSDWGTEHYTLATQGRGTGDYLRVLTDEGDTAIWIDDSYVGRFAAGAHYDVPRSAATRITSSKPVTVAQFAQGCKASPDPDCHGDPFMTLVPPTSQWQQRYHATVPTPTIPNQADSYVHRIAIVAPIGAVGQVRMDGVTLSPAAFGAIAGSGFAQYQAITTTGLHVVDAPLPVQVSLYGFTGSESYAHAAAGAPLTVPPASPDTPDADDVLVRYVASGARDANFGDGGLAVVDHRAWFETESRSLDRAVRAFADGDGVLVASASTNTASAQQILLAYRVEAGALFKDGFE